MHVLGDRYANMKKIIFFYFSFKDKNYLCVHNMQQQQGNKWPEHEWFSKESKPKTIREIESRSDTLQLKDEEKDERMVDPIHCNTCKTASPSSIIQLRFQYNERPRWTRNSKRSPRTDKSHRMTLSRRQTEAPRAESRQPRESTGFQRHPCRPSYIDGRKPSLGFLSRPSDWSIWRWARQILLI